MLILNRSKTEACITAIQTFIVESGVVLRSEKPEVEFFEEHAYVEFDVKGDDYGLDQLEEQIAVRFPNTSLMFCEESHGKVLVGNVFAFRIRV
jgi:hypothetical protein